MKSSKRVSSLLFRSGISATVLACLLSSVSFGAAKNTTSSSAGSTSTKLLPPPNNPVTALIAKYDTDHDGKIDRFEIKKMQTDEPDVYADAITFDADHDGWLNVQEVTAWKIAGAPTAAAATPPKSAGSKKSKGN